MMILFDWECAGCGATFEEFEHDGKKPLCPVCFTDSATKLIGAPRIDPRLGLDASGFPSMGAKWAKRRAQHQRTEERRHREHDD